MWTFRFSFTLRKLRLKAVKMNYKFMYQVSWQLRLKHSGLLIGSSSAGRTEETRWTHHLFRGSKGLHCGRNGMKWLFKNLLPYQRKWKYVYVMASQKQQSLWLAAWLPGCLFITYIIYHNFHWQCCSPPIHRMTLMASDGNVPLVVRMKFVVRHFTPAVQCECRLRSLI